MSDWHAFLALLDLESLKANAGFLFGLISGGFTLGIWWNRREVIHARSERDSLRERLTLAEQKLDSAEIGRRAMFYWCEVNFNRKPTEIEIRQMIYVIESERKAAE